MVIFHYLFFGTLDITNTVKYKNEPLISIQNFKKYITFIAFGNKKLFIVYLFTYLYVKVCSYYFDDIETNLALPLSHKYPKMFPKISRD